MKKLILTTIVSFILLCTMMAQQVPLGMKYQAVARDAKGQVIANKSIALRIGLSPEGKSMEYSYLEKHRVITNEFGLFTLTIGGGEVLGGTFSSVPWATYQILLELAVDETGGDDFKVVHTGKLLTVPYAFHAGTANQLLNGNNEPGTLGDDDDNPDPFLFSKFWQTEGNKDIDDKKYFIGTVDEQRLVFKTNNLYAMHIDFDQVVHMDNVVIEFLDVEFLDVLNDLNVRGNTFLEQNVHMNIKGGSTTIEGPTTIHNTLDVDGSTHLNRTGGTTTIDGVTTITNLTNSTDPTNGALNVDGGVGIEKDMNVAGNTHINFNNPGNTTTIDGVTTITHPLNSTLPTNGALNVDGGVGIEKDMNVTGKVHINFDSPDNTTTIDGVTTITHPLNSTNPTNGALNVDGGVGIEKDMNVTGKVHINFDSPDNTTTIDGVTTITHPLNSTLPTNGALNVDGGVGIEKDMNVTGKVHINFDSPDNTTTIDGVTTITHPLNSTLPTNGALNVDGGVGIEKDMNVTGKVHINFDSPDNTTTIDGVTTITHPLNSTAPTNGALNVDGGVGIEKDVNIGGHTKIDKTLRVIANGSEGVVADNHIAHFENLQNGNGICIQVGSGAPTHGNNFITFKNSGGGVVGRIEGETIADLPNNDDYQQELDFYDIDIEMAEKEIEMEENERIITTAELLIAMQEAAIQTAQLGMAMAEATAADMSQTSTNCMPPGCMTMPIPSFIGSSAANVIEQGLNEGIALENVGTATGNEVLAFQNVANAEENKAQTEAKKQAFIDLYQLQIGVTYESGAGDYAEYLPKLNPEVDFRPGDVVGMKNGWISKNTLGADRVMVISLKPAVLGALPKEGTEDQFEKVAFLGQVLTKTTGKVAKGDYILPSGWNNGYAIAKHPDEMLLSDYKKILGVAWGDSDSDGINYVKVAVGLNVNDFSSVIQQQQKEIEALKSQINQTNHILADLVPGFREAANLEAAPTKVAASTSATTLSTSAYTADNTEGEASDSFIPERSDYENAIKIARQVSINRGVDVENHPFWNRLDTDPDYMEELVLVLEKKYVEEQGQVEINDKK